MRVLIAGFVWLCACFSPDERDGVIVCGKDDVCPPGYVCGEHKKCWRNPPATHTPAPERSDGMDDDCDAIIDGKCMSPLHDDEEH